MKKYLVIFLLIAFSGTVMSQELFTGIVMDSTKHVIKGAQVSLKNKNEVVAVYTTGADGVFSVKDLNPDSYDINIACVGYKTYNGKVNVGNGNFQFFTLTENVFDLNEITVTAHRPPKTTALGHIYYLSEKAKKVTTLLQR